MSSRRTRPNGYENDVKAPDGFLLGGWRRVCKGGYINFHHIRWTHPELTGYVGQYVFVHVDCCWATEASWTDDKSKIWHRGDRKPLTEVVTDRRRLDADDSDEWYSGVQLEEIEQAKREAAP